MPDSVKSYLSGLDKLPEYQVQDSVTGFAGEVPAVDTVYNLADEGFILYDSLASSVDGEMYQTAAAADVFGDATSLAEGVSEVEQAMMSEFSSVAISWPDVMLHLIVAVVSALYIFCIYRYYYDVIALIQTAMQRDIRVSERNNERRRSDIFYGFLGKLFLLGIGFVAIFVAFWAIHHSEAVVPLSSHLQLLSPVIGVGLFVAVAVVQYLILFVVGLVTRSLAMASALTQMRLTYFVLATIVVAPLLLVAEMASAYHAWYIVATITACVVLVFYLRESVGAFISKKISILHWFLYLCTVEILPLTLLWQIAVRLG